MASAQRYVHERLRSKRRHLTFYLCEGRYNIQIIKASETKLKCLWVCLGGRGGPRVPVAPTLAKIIL